jgi:hypothetical protein
MKTMTRKADEFDERSAGTDSPRSAWFQTALQGLPRAHRDQRIAEALMRVAAIENAAELSVLVGSPRPARVRPV